MENLSNTNQVIAAFVTFKSMLVREKYLKHEKSAWKQKIANKMKSLVNRKKAT